MGNHAALIISPAVFDFLLYMMTFLFGVDFTLSGFLVLKSGTKYLEKPKLLGLIIIKLRNKAYEKSQKPGRLLTGMYSLKYMKFYTFISGIVLLIGSTIRILDVLF